jgi:glycoside/pentoside/hexuronide:cation symporter, GPH family
MLSKIKNIFSGFKAHWLTPAKGRYMSYKEITSFSVGSIGLRLIIYCVGNMIISVGNTLIGNTIGIDPGAIYVIYIISILSGFPLTALRAKMIDNTRSMKGKYRPYILTMGLPTVILAIGFVWMPYERMSLMAKCITVLLYNIGFQFFYNFLTDANDSLINVLSPNTIERSDVLSVKNIVENISPSIVTILLPVFAKLITKDNTLYDIRIYRYLYPPMLLISFFISLLVYVNVEEKVVQAKTHVIRLKFWDAFRAIAQNKYFWVISLAGWIGFLESSFSSILGWMYNYQGACTPAQYSIITAIAGNASFWPNVVAPILIRKYGKKKLLVATNILNICFIALMLPIVKQTGSHWIIWLLLGCVFVNQFMTSLGHLLNPSIQADIRDYQQYKTGERIDGMFAAVGLIGSVITLLTSSVLPTIYEKAGLNQDVAVSLGYDGSNVYDVLFNADYFVKISSVLVIASIVGATLNVIPFFFYDLTEAKQKAMVKVLKLRAVFEDLGNGVVKDEAIVEAAEILKESEEYSNRIPVEISKEGMRKSKRQGKEEYKKAKAEYKNNLIENEKIETARLVNAELNRFNTPEGIADLELAKSINDAGLDGFMSVITFTKEDVRSMPVDTPEHKERKKDMSRLLGDVKTSQKAIAKYFPNGIVPFDSSVFDELFKSEDEAELEKNKILSQIKAAKNEKNSSEEAALKTKLKAVMAQNKEIGAKIKKATNDNSVYYRAAKPYLDAVKLIKQSENYANLQKIFDLAATSKENLEKREEEVASLN